MNIEHENSFVRIRERLRAGEISAAEGNVLLVRAQRVMLVTKLTREVRAALNAAVKRGELGHVKKDGRKPEAYFHPSFDYMVAGKRNEYEKKILESIKSVCI